MTAGLWSLGELSPRLYRHLAKLGSQLAAGLADAAREAGVALQVNAFGSVVTPFFTRVAGAWKPSVGDRRQTPACMGSSSVGCWRGIYPPPSQFERTLSQEHTPNAT